ncbi:deuterosome assembly protein 1 isoform X2 [Ambystoma mexicanum]|uniref:deuterosome assembly protein 1 isoform X2 n=1 Tax=Ambystoma mexicanum TaxID=8296 RepID=UPI0037E87324
MADPSFGFSPYGVPEGKNMDLAQEMASLGDFFRMGNTTCETELQGLMHQIDIMVQNSKSEWERKSRALEAMLQIRDQEIEQKSAEVESLQQKLGKAQKKYEGQLNLMKSELRKLKNTYEKLQTHKMKHTKHPAKDTNICKLNQKLEEYKVKSKEWDKQRSLYQKQLASMDAERKSWAEKCEELQKQVQAYQAQLNNQRHLLDEAIVSSQSDNRRLKCKLDSSHEAIKGDGLLIENLKYAVSEVTSDKNLLQTENQHLLQELKRAQEQCQKLEAELSKSRIALQSRDDVLEIVEMEQVKLKQEVAKYRELITIHENAKSFECSHLQFQPFEELTKKKMELHLNEPFLDNQQIGLGKTRNHIFQQEYDERMMREVSELREQLRQKDITIASIIDSSCIRESQLKAELEIKEKLLSKQQNSTMNRDIPKRENKHHMDIIDNYDDDRTRNSVMNRDVPKRENKHHMDIIDNYDDDRTRNSVMNRDVPKRENKHHMDIIDNYDDDRTRTSVMNRDVQKKEHKHYLDLTDDSEDDRAMTSMKNRDTQKKETKHFTEMIDNFEDERIRGLKALEEKLKHYPVSVTNLQDKNDSLQNDLENLQNKLERSLEVLQKQSGAYWEGHHNEAQVKTNLERAFGSENEWQINHIMDDIRYYTSKDISLGNNSNLSHGHGGRAASPMQRANISREPAMDALPACSAAGCHNHQKNLRPDPDMSNIFLDSLYSKGDNTPPTSHDRALSAAEQFLREEEKRSKEFEKILGSHIDELHRNSEEAITKFTTRLSQHRHM